MQDDVIEQENCCWRATGVRVHNDDPCITRNSGDVPLIRLIYASMVGGELPKMIHAGCGLHGKERKGCVNPFPHNPANPPIFVKLRGFSLGRETHRQPSEVELSSQFQPLYRQPLSDEQSEQINQLLKAIHRAGYRPVYRSADLQPHWTGGEKLFKATVKLARKQRLLQNWQIQL